MPRYKIVGVTRCEHGHMNLFDERPIAESEAVAQKLAIANAVKLNCAYCNTPSPLTLQQLMGTEEISLHMEFTIYGYTCHCGERVEVERVEAERGLTPPISKTVSCSKGHERTVRNQDFLSLQRWRDKTN
jgi:hypothetical protein